MAQLPPPSVIVVETETEARTLRRLLGKQWQVVSTGGQLRQLQREGIGFKVKSMRPIFEPMADDRLHTLLRIIDLAGNHPRVYVAASPTRYGDAIAYHLTEALSSVTDVRRVVFRELTAEGIAAALRRQEAVSSHQNDAFWARRMLHRMVQHQVGPVLNKALGTEDLAITRIQAAILQLLVERETERRFFVPQRQWCVEVTTPSGIVAQSRSVPYEQLAERYRDLFCERDYVIAVRSREETAPSPPEPCNTADMLVAMCERGFSIHETMEAAERLYCSGKITFPYTNTRTLDSKVALAARSVLREQQGRNVVRKRPIPGEGQCIRPTDILTLPSPSSSTAVGTLYRLLHERVVQSQMRSAKVKVCHLQYRQRNSQRILAEVQNISQVTPGYAPEEMRGVPVTRQGCHLEEPSDCVEVVETQTEPKQRHTEGTLLLALKEIGVCHIHSIVSALDGLRALQYVRDTDYEIDLTLRGEVVAQFIRRAFQHLANPAVVGRIEQRLSDIADGVVPMRPYLKSYWRKVLGPAVERVSLDAQAFAKDLPRCSCKRRTGETFRLRLGKPGTVPYIECPVAGCGYMDGIEFDQRGRLRIFTSRKVLGRCSSCKSESLQTGQNSNGVYTYCTVCGKPA